jgi:O-antigen/teichoic acid export membrane protein
VPYVAILPVGDNWFVRESDSLEALAVQFRRYQENQVARNSFYSLLQFVVPTLLLLALTPVLIHQMGTENFVLWILASSALGLMSIAEFGLNTAISKFVAEFVGSGDTKALSVVVSGGLIAYILLGIGLVIPLYVFSPALAGIFRSSEALSAQQIGFVIRIMSLGFIPLLLRSGAMAIPIGLQRFEIPVIITVGYQILSYLTALIVTLSGGSVAQVVSSTVAVLWITALGGSFVAWQMLKPFKLKFMVRRSRKILQKLFSFALMSGISDLGGRIFGFADRLAVGAVLGLEAVAYYTVIISVAAKILQLSSALTSALMPAASAWMASGATRRVRAYFLKGTGLLLTLNFLIAVALLALSRPLLHLWMGEDFASHALLPFRVLTVIYALISLGAPAHYVAFGIGKPGINALAGMLGGCLTIGLILIWGRTLGLLGTAIANGGYLIIWANIGYIYFRLDRVIKQAPAMTEFSGAS